MFKSIITRTGSYIPSVKVVNEQFLGNEFFAADGTEIAKSNVDIVNKLQEIIGIRERRYVEDDLNTSDIAFMAAEQALDGTDRESLDYIIVAQNLGDVRADNIKTDMVPTISWLGNSSVATLPTMLDLMQRGNLDHHRLHSGDTVIFASVGAGMNINSMVYRVP